MSRTPEQLVRHAEAQRRYREKNPASAYAAERKWIANNPEKRRSINNRASRSRYYRDSHKVHARNILNKAIRDGKAFKPELCAQCQKPIPVQAHHPDYSKPLDVLWLCRPCHLSEHK